MCVTWGWWWGGGGGWGLWLWYDEDDYSGDNLDKDDDDDDDDDDIATSPRLRTDSVKSPGFPLLGLRSGFLSSSGIVIILFMFSPDRNPRYKHYHIIIVHQWSPGKKTSIAPSLEEQVLRLDSMDVWVEPTSAGHYDSLSLFSIYDWSAQHFDNRSSFYSTGPPNACKTFLFPSHFPFTVSLSFPRYLKIVEFVIFVPAKDELKSTSHCCGSIGLQLPENTRGTSSASLWSSISAGLDHI